MNLFHGRAHEGKVHPDEGLQLASPEHAAAHNAKACAYVRPHDVDLSRPGRGVKGGILARLSRAVVVGPIARLELLPQPQNQGSGENPDSIIEAGSRRSNSGSLDFARARRW